MEHVLEKVDEILINWPETGLNSEGLINKEMERDWIRLEID